MKICSLCNGTGNLLGKYSEECHICCGTGYLQQELGYGGYNYQKALSFAHERELIAATKLVEELHAANVEDKIEFSFLVDQGMRAASLSEKDVARKFGTALGTISRWRKGHTAPAMPLRKIVLEYLANELTERVLKAP